MGFSQDPYKHIGYLQQCLSNDKRPLGIFLGAGCPVSVKAREGETAPLIPDIAGITKMIREEIDNSNNNLLLNSLDAYFKADGRDVITVEDMLTHIRALRVVAGNDEVRGLCAEQLDTLDDNICQLIHRFADRVLPDKKTPYHRLASWVDAVRRESPIEVFTTNYDLLMEQAFEDFHVPYFDGFAGVRKPFFDLRAMEEDMLPARWARLWKLHGSINWYQVADKGVFRGTTTAEGGMKRVIHPSHMKYQESRRMPYLAMIDRLRAFLKQPIATLVICGYSFRDEHINEIILQGLESTQTAIAFALLYGSIDNYSQAVTLAKGRNNLTLLGRDGGVISGRSSKWTEKEPEAIPPDNGKWIVWKPIDPNDNRSKHIASFELGDFSIFGEFLYELVGNVRQISELNNA